MQITEDEARAAYAAQQEKAASRNIQEFASGIKILNGPYGPYVTDGKKNARLSKDIDPKKVTEEEAKELLAKKPAKIRKKTAK
jgi:DNA topoisomerase-1